MNYAPVTSPANSDEEDESDEDVVRSSQPREPARAGSFLDFVNSLNHLQGSTAPAPPSLRTVQKTEAELFLEETPVPMETDPLEWWGENEYRFPNLRRMAQRYLMVPASSASAERVFSLAGRLYSDLRQHMKDGTLEERMWGKVNIENPTVGHTR